jgi:hypothetical protein
MYIRQKFGAILVFVTSAFTPIDSVTAHTAGEETKLEEQHEKVELNMLFQKARMSKGGVATDKFYDKLLYADTRIVYLFLSEDFPAVLETLFPGLSEEKILELLDKKAIENRSIGSFTEVRKKVKNDIIKGYAELLEQLNHQEIYMFLQQKFPDVLENRLSGVSEREFSKLERKEIAEHVVEWETEQSEKESWKRSPEEILVEFFK